MTEPRDQSQRRSEPGPSGGASRFWEQYASARSHRTGREENGHESEPAAAAPATGHECLDWCPVCRGADVVRATAPPEIRDQWNAFQRDALTMLRALIDAYLGRLDTPPGHQPPPGTPPPRRAADQRVQDIRID